MNFKSIFMSMLAVAALASCNNDDEIPVGGTQEGNASSWLGIKVSIPASSFGGTRAVDGDDNAATAEAVINKISLYYKKTDGTVDIISTPLDIKKDFVKSGATYTASKAVKIPVAANSAVDIYAIVNNGTTNPIRPNWFNFRGTAADPDVNYWTATTSELSSLTDGFVMTGTATGTTVADSVQTTTHASISIERAVAKVLVTASENGINPTNNFDETNINGVSGKFQGGTLSWTIGNINRKLYLLQNKITKDELTVVKDPNWSKIPAGTLDEALADDYENRNPVSYSISVPQYSGALITGYELADAKVLYCTENTNEEYQHGNTTFISVKAAFIPNKIVTTVTGTVDDDDVSMNAETNTATTAATFYYYPAESKYLTADAYKAATENAKIAESEFKGPYKNGECYYFVPIADKDGKLGVLRNSYYTMRIKSLKAPGEPTPNPGHNEDPVEQNSWIAVDFTVANWNPVAMGDFDLE